MAPEDTSSRVLVIGVEGATWRTLTPAIEAGHMPFLRHLVNSGASGTLFSTVPHSTATAWAAFQTGCNPGSTGVFCSTIVDPSSKSARTADSSAIKETVWDQVSRLGRRVAVMNIPLAWPPRQINGVVVASPLAAIASSESTWPPDLAEELGRCVAVAGIGRHADYGLQPPYKDVEAYVDWAVTSVRTRAAAAEHIIFTRSPDLAMVHIDACDKLQHSLWCYLDPADPLFDEDKQRYIFERFFGGLDQAIKDICDAFTRAASGQVSVILASDHGFELHRKRFNLSSWLIEQKLLQPGAAEQSPAQEPASWLDRILVRLGLRKPATRTDWHFAGKMLPVDWRTSQTLLIGDGDAAGIYLLSNDDAHRRNTITRITKGLKAMRDPFTSAPIAATIHRREELYKGPRLDMMPDLIVVPAAGYSFRCDAPAGVPLIEDVSQDTARQLGKHHAEGIIVACGPGIADKIGVVASITDVTPSILYTLGLPIPAACDGKVITDLFTEDFVASRNKP